MVHVGVHSVGTYHKKFGGQNVKNKNMVCRVFIEDTRQSLLCRVPSIWHSANKPFCRVPVFGSRQRLTAVSFRTDADGPLPSAFFISLPSVVLCRVCPALGKEARYRESNFAGFAECPKKSTRQRGRHSAKPRIPVVKLAKGPTGAFFCRVLGKEVVPVNETSL
jgi:CDGSH-type Zn-finger protein